MVSSYSAKPVRRRLRFLAGACTATATALLMSCTQQKTLVTKKPNAIFVTTTLAKTTSTISIDGEAPVTPGLADICPRRIVVQLDRGIDFWTLPWIAMTASDGIATPSSYTALFVDPLERVPDTNRQGEQTGFSIELRFGGRKGQASVADTLLRDPSVLVGSVNAESLMATGNRDKLRFILAPFERSDRVIAWDPAAIPKEQPAIETIADLPPMRVRAVNGDRAIGYFANTGLIRKTDFTTGQAPGRFTNLLDEPNLFAQAKGARNWRLLDEAGWTTYPSAIVVTPATLTNRKECLAALSSLLQLSLGVIVGEPERFAANLSSIATRMGTPLDPTLLASQIRVAVKLGIIGTGDNTVIADVQPTRIEQILRSLAKSRKDKYKQKDISRLSTSVTESLASFDWIWQAADQAE